MRNRTKRSFAVGHTKASFPRPGRRYIALNKPFDVISQFTPIEGSDAATLSEFGIPKGLYPVGRLDHDSEGLLLLSDDPALTTALHGRTGVHWRTYLVQVERIPSAETLDRLASGVVVKGRTTLPCRVQLLAQPPELPPRPVPIRVRKTVSDCWLELQLAEGRNRQVRRMTAAVGHPTLRLWRESIGALSLRRLKLAPGQWRALRPEELRLALKLSP